MSPLFLQTLDPPVFIQGMSYRYVSGGQQIYYANSISGI